MPGSAEKLTRICNDLSSGTELACVKAVGDLLVWCRADPSIHSAALPLLRSAATLTDFPFIANNAVNGIGLIAGHAEAQRYRHEFMRDSNAQLIKATVLNLDDPADVPAVIALLHRSSDHDLKMSAVRMLGRLGGPAAFDALIQSLAEPVLRPHAIDALGDLGDLRAVPHLEPLCTDTTPAYPADNHAPMLHVSDLAKSALAKLTAPPPPQSLPPPIPPAPPASRAHRAPLFSLLAPIFCRERIWSYVPLLILLLEIPWIVLCTFGLMFAVGDYSPQGISPHQSAVFSAACMIPVYIACASGIYGLLFHRSRRTLDLFCLLLGTALCGILAFLSFKGYGVR